MQNPEVILANLYNVSVSESAKSCLELALNRMDYLMAARLKMELWNFSNKQRNSEINQELLALLEPMSTAAMAKRELEAICKEYLALRYVDMRNMRYFIKPLGMIETLVDRIKRLSPAYEKANPRKQEYEKILYRGIFILESIRVAMEDYLKYVIDCTHSY